MNKMKDMDVSVEKVTEEVFSALELQDRIERNRASMDYSEGRDDMLHDLLDGVLEGRRFNQLENELFNKVLPVAERITFAIDKYADRFMDEVTDIENNTVNSLCLFANGYVGYKHDAEAKGQAIVFSLRTDWDYWQGSQLANEEGSLDPDQYSDFENGLVEAVENVVELYIENWLDLSLIHI